jgi:predicted transcriptional regulator of viral defense system
MGTFVERRKMNREMLRRLARARVLTTRDLARLLDTSPEVAKKTALRLRKRGLLKRVKRGEYASVPLDVDPARYTPDPYLVVERDLRTDYAFSHSSALELFGGARAPTRSIHVSAPNARARRKALGNLVVHVHRAAFAGWKESTTTVSRGGRRLPVTTPERTLLDLVSLPNSQQGYEESLEAFRYLLPRTNPSKFTALILSSPRVSVKARAGHLLLRSFEGQSSPAAFNRLLAQLSRGVASAGTSYFGTRPNLPFNRFDQEFRLVYPGGR